MPYSYNTPEPNDSLTDIYATALGAGQDQLLSWINEMRKPVVIAGPPNKAKKELAIHYSSYFINQYNGNTIWINATTLTSILDDCEQIFIELYGKRTDKNNNDDKSMVMIFPIFEHFELKKTLFVFENVGSDNFFVYELFGYAGRQTKILVISDDLFWDENNFCILPIFGYASALKRMTINKVKTLPAEKRSEVNSREHGIHIVLQSLRNDIKGSREKTQEKLDNMAPHKFVWNNIDSNELYDLSQKISGGFFDNYDQLFTKDFENDTLKENNENLLIDEITEINFMTTKSYNIETNDKFEVKEENFEVKESDYLYTTKNPRFIIKENDDIFDTQENENDEEDNEILFKEEEEEKVTDNTQNLADFFPINEESKPDPLNPHDKMDELLRLKRRFWFKF